MHTYKNSHRKAYLAIIASILFFIPFGCGNKEKEIPGMNVPGIRTYVSRILISPLAFDGAIVAVEGIAHDVQEITEGEGKIITAFKLSDLRGNFINVSIQGKQNIAENDPLIVGGIYRRVKNEIEAEQFEKIELKE